MASKSMSCQNLPWRHDVQNISWRQKVRQKYVRTSESSPWRQNIRHDVYKEIAAKPSLQELPSNTNHNTYIIRNSSVNSTITYHKQTLLTKSVTHIA